MSGLLSRRHRDDHPLHNSTNQVRQKLIAIMVGIVSKDIISDLIGLKRGPGLGE
jgi:hypothetical protein